MSNEDTDDTTIETLSRNEFGFTWGETDGTIWLRSDDGSYKRLQSEFFDRLLELARTETEPESIDDEVQQAIELLFDEGYVEPHGEVVRHEMPSGIRLGPRIGAFALTVSLLGAVLVRQRGEFRQLLTDFEFGVGTSLVVLSVLLASIALHELGHYIPSQRYFEPNIRFSRLNGIIPAIITRTTDAWRCPRSVRIWISLAGPFVDAVIALAFAIAFLLAPNQPVFGFLAVLITARMVFVLNPLLEGDGYWILVDTMGWHNLRSRGVDDLKNVTVSLPALYTLSTALFTVGVAVAVLSMLVTVLDLI